MIQNRDIETLSDFQQNAPGVLARLAKSKAPLFLTVDGVTRAVVQDAAAYQELLKKVEEAEVILAVREGLEEVARGEGFELDEADDIMRRQLGFPPRQ